MYNRVYKIWEWKKCSKKWQKKSQNCIFELHHFCTKYLNSNLYATYLYVKSTRKIFNIKNHFYHFNKTFSHLQSHIKHTSTLNKLAIIFGYRKVREIYCLADFFCIGSTSTYCFRFSFKILERNGMENSTKRRFYEFRLPLVTRKWSLFPSQLSVLFEWLLNKTWNLSISQGRGRLLKRLPSKMSV